MIAHASFDAEVVAEWQRRHRAFRRSSRWLWGAFWLVVLLAPLPFILGVVDVKPGAFVVAFVLSFVGLHLRYRHLQILACPHCGKPPTPDRFGQMTLGKIDCCPHCSYWLVDLRGGSHDA